MAFFSSKTKAPAGGPKTTRGSSTPLASRLFSSASSSLGNSSGGKSIGGFSRGSVNQSGTSVFYCTEVDELCGGLIGAGSKFCCRAKSSCTISSHKKRPFDGLVSGLYVKADTHELYTSPILDTHPCSEEVIQAFLTKDFQDVREVIRYFSIVADSETFVTYFSDLEAKNEEMKASLFGKTPSKRRKVDILGQYEDLMEEYNRQGDGSSMEADIPDTALERISAMLQIIVTSMAEDQMTMRMMDDKIGELFIQVGNPAAMGLSSAPSLWTEVVNLKDEADNMKSRISEIKSIATSFSAPSGEIATVQQLADTERRLDSERESLATNTANGFATVEEEFHRVRGDGYDHLHGESLETVTDAINLAATKVQQIEKRMSDLEELPGKGASSFKPITIGRFNFRSYQDLNAWAEKHLPPSLPFGGFVDVYSFLERVKSFKDAASSTELKEMETRKKLELSADEALALESFKHPLPKVFNGGSSEDTLVTTWLPGIVSKRKWEDEYGLSGAKITIRDNIEVIRTRIESIITERLRNHKEAEALAMQLLSDTIAFLESLSRFITETYDRLALSGFGKDRSWLLVSKLVHRLFATDCHLRRGAVSEVLDATDTRVLSLGVLYGTFSTHQVMREYSRYGIENHPSISSEYVRFLVANSGLTKIEALSLKCDKMATEVKEAKVSATAAQKAANTAANKADMVEKAAKVKK